MSSARWSIRIARLTLPAWLLVLAACSSALWPWKATIVAPDGDSYTVNRRVLRDMAVFAEEEPGVPLEQLLWEAGHQAAERVTVTGPDGARTELDWATRAGDSWWQENGKLSTGGEILDVSQVEVTPPALLEQVQARIIDLAPTAAVALGLPVPAQATGRALDVPAARHVAILLLDGFGYARSTEVVPAGLIPSLSLSGEPLVGLTTYPPVTSVSMASLLTGAPPQVHGANRRGIRTTEVQTLFDVAEAAGLRVVAVEGQALPFNLPGVELQLSGDRDGNDSTDDNVLANTLAVIEDGMPDLLFVHFHGIDDAGHRGPGSAEESAAIQEVDAAVGQILAGLPADTLVLISADHGMHAVDEEGMLGNHGNLVERDMFIPIWIISR